MSDNGPGDTGSMGASAARRVEGVPRRTLLAGIAAGVAGAVTGGAATPSHEHAADTTADAAQQGRSATAAPAAAPRCFDDHQRRTLTSLAGLLVPGSVAAGAVDLIDRVAAVESPARQRQLVNALGQFEQEARLTRGVRWLDLDEAAQRSLLDRVSQLPASRPPQPTWTRGQPIVFPRATPAAPTLRDHLEVLRTAIANAYFATEAGMKELGWTGRTSWRELPACTHPNPEH